MAPDPASVAIIGGGPVGLVCALLLAERGVGTLVIEARPRTGGSPVNGAPRRLLALSRGTLDVLAALSLRDLPVAPIEDVRVSSAGEPGTVRLRAAELGGRALGATIYYDQVLDRIEQRVAATASITMLQPRRVVGAHQQPHQVEIELDGGERRAAPVLIHAEGAGVPVDEQGAALVGELTVEGLAAGVAIERFTRDGPLALLPVPGPTDGAQPALRSATSRRALVWCMDRMLAQQRLELDDCDFIAALNQALGSRQGRIVAADARSRVPLAHGWRRELNAHRIAFAGNAAQSLHPVAGQGLNLGVRDAVTLADCLAEALQAAAPDPVAALARYDRRRRVDRTLIASLTGRLPGLFATSSAPIALARTAGLLLLGAAAPLRRQFAHVLMFGVRS